MQRLACGKLFNTFISKCEKRFIHKQRYKMEYMYFRHEDQSEMFQISFRYANDVYGVDREFNFCRNISENIEDCVHRMKVNLEKAFMKKIKKKQKAPTTEVLPVVLDVQFFRNGETLAFDYTCQDVLKNSDCVTVHVIDRVYEVVVNAPWIQSLQLPGSLLAEFPIYPSKIELKFVKLEQCTFTWYRGKFGDKHNPDHVEWTKIGEGYIINTRNEDVGFKLKLVCEPRNGSLIGPSAECISTTPVEAGPGVCPFDTRHLFTKEYLSGNSFRVCSYNILADLYCDSDFTRTTLHPYCPPYALSIDYRKQLILKELLGYNFDIACLQEVDSKVFDLDLIPVLSSVGYSGVFKKKGATVAEGLAVFYNKRFKLLNSHGIILGEHISKDDLYHELWKKIENNKSLVDRLCERTTAVQAVVLQNIDCPDRIVIVANTHLYFHPDADHIRLLQAGFGVTWVHHIFQQTQSEFPDQNVSLIFCGDFNSVPQCGIYQLMTTQHVPENVPDWSSNAEQAVLGVSLSQRIKMGSACGTPQYTNFTTGFADCLDYIFYQEDAFEVDQVIPLPSLDELQLHTALPSIVFPSDHIALVADLKWKIPKC